MRIVQNIFLPNAAMIAADAIDAFAAEGVEVATVFTRSSLDQRASLLAGESDVAVTALDNLFAWNRSDDDAFRAVAQIERTTSLPIYLAGVMSLDELASLPKPRLVVDSPASGFGIALVALVEGLGMERDCFEVIGVGGVNERLAALATGTGDVALLASFVEAAAVDAGLVRAGALEDVYPTYPGLVVATRHSRLVEAEEPMRAYLRALAAGRDWLASNPAAGVGALVASGLPEPAARRQLALCGDGPLTVSAVGFALLHRLRAEQGLLPPIACDYEDFVLGGFADINLEGN